MVYEPFIDDPDHIRAVEGQRFVVLRPDLAIREAHRHLQSLLRERGSGLPISYPAQAHVTLAGFGADTQLNVVQDLVESWSHRVSPLRITVERLEYFPAPAQILIIRVLKTAELLSALSGLRREASHRRLTIDTTIPLHDWVFHMSVAYCADLSGPAWNDVMKLSKELEIPPASCNVNEIEVVAFDNLREYSGGVYAFAQARQAP
jgi:2'-5' RNA ligase